MTSYRHLSDQTMTEEGESMLLPKFKSCLVLLLSLLLLFFIYSPSAASAGKYLEKEIQHWLAHQGFETDSLVIQVNDSRLQVPICESKFQLDQDNGSNASIPRTVKASCHSSDWSRLIRIKTKNQPLKNVRSKIFVATTTVLVTESPINQYAKVFRDELVSKEIPNNRLPPNALKVSHSLKNSYATKPLRAGHIITTTDLTSPKKVVIIKASMPAQTVIKRPYFSMEYRLKGIPQDAIHSLDGLENLATNRLLHPGDVLRKRDLSKAKLVKRGDLVLVEAKSNVFQIVNEAIAFQDGYLGDQIKLTSVDSKREIQATVIGQGKVSTLSKRWVIK